MDCRKFHRNLEDYLEGGMDFSARFAMERHAGQCYSCEKTVKNAMKLRQLARDLDRARAPIGFEQSLLARIQERKTTGFFSRIRDGGAHGSGLLSWRTVTVAALATAIVAGSITYWHFGSASRRQSAAAIGNEPSLGAITALDASISEDQILKMIQNGNEGVDQWAQPLDDPSETDFVEVQVPVSGDRHLVLRLPRTIWMRYSQPSKEYILRTISH
jgi:anti-sigma factor RsiW